jgi:hypothetical protein
MGKSKRVVSGSDYPVYTPPEPSALRWDSGREVALRPPIDSHLERITLLMDKAIRIPGTNITFGLDPIIGLVLPVAGDTISAIISTYIVAVSVRYGIPKGVIAKMVLNIAADFLLGSIPFVGDAADFVLKANTRNLRLLNKHASGQRGSFWSDWAWLLVLVGLLFLSIAGGLTLIYFAIKQTGIGLI